MRNVGPDAAPTFVVRRHTRQGISGASICGRGTAFVGVPTRAGSKPSDAIVALDLLAAVDLALDM